MSGRPVCCAHTTAALAPDATNLQPSMVHRDPSTNTENVMVEFLKGAKSGASHGGASSAKKLTIHTRL